MALVQIFKIFFFKKLKCPKGLNISCDNWDGMSNLYKISKFQISHPSSCRLALVNNLVKVTKKSRLLWQIWTSSVNGCVNGFLWIYHSAQNILKKSDLKIFFDKKMTKKNGEIWLILQNISFYVKEPKSCILNTFHCP